MSRKMTAILTLSLIVVVGIALLMGPLAFLLRGFQFSSLWSANTHATYYFLLYSNQYGVFWSLFPVAMVTALLAKQRPAFFCISVFTIVFLLHSFAAMRAERYLFYAMPFFVTIWGIALCDIARRSYYFVVRELSARKFAGFAVTRPETLSASIVAFSAAWLILMTPATEITARMVLNKPAHELRYWFYQVTSWSSAKNRITELVEESDVFLTSQGHHAIYYIGDFDVEISATGLSDFKSGSGGSDIDPRTGRRVIADRTALQGVVFCNKSGVVVVDRRSWRLFAGVNNDVADFIEDNMHHIETPEDWGMVIYQWRDGDTVERENNSVELLPGMTCSR